MNRVIVPARQATWAGGIFSLESIPGLHKRLKIRALVSRDPWCRTRASVLHPLEDLPKTSIIICFCNEAWSTLVRYTHCNENPIYVFFFFWELRGLSPHFHIQWICERLIYSRDRSTYFLQKNIGRSIMGIYKSLTNT